MRRLWSDWRLVAALIAITLCCYSVALIASLRRHDFDFTRFINAGSQYTDQSQLPFPIFVYTPSTGYDGEFYYRISVAPLSIRKFIGGVSFDHAPYRLQRIVYPLTVKFMTLGHVTWTPVVMVLANLIGLVFIAIAACRLTERLQCPWWTPIAILIWPGFIITVYHDTTEITSAATILWALELYLAGRSFLFAIVGCAAVLSRETNLLAFAGLGLYELSRTILARKLVPSHFGALALIAVTFFAWRAFISILWGASPSAGVAANNLDWPFIGMGKALIQTFDGTRSYLSRRFLCQELVGLLMINVYSLTGLIRSVRAVREAKSSCGPLAFAWLPILATMTILSAGGPLVDSTAFFRAFTEWYVVGAFFIFPALAKPTISIVNLVLLAGLWIIAAELANIQTL